MLSRLIDDPDKVLDFGLAPDDEFVSHLRMISKSRDAFVEQSVNDEVDKAEKANEEVERGGYIIMAFR
jgi:hypothetical protein